MKNVIENIIFIYLLSANIAFSQENDSVKLNGYYHPFNKTFTYEKTTAHPVKDAYVKYFADDFTKGIAIVRKEHFYYTNEEGIETSNKTVHYGAIDTTGTIIIPCKYENLSHLKGNGDSTYFYFHTQDSITLLNINEKKLLVLRNDSPKIPEKIFWDSRTQFRNIDSKGNLALSYNGRSQLYNIYKKKFIVPPFYLNSNSESSIEQMKYGIIEIKKRFVLYSNTPYKVDYDEINGRKDLFDLYGNSLDFFVYDKENFCFSNRYKLISFYNDSLIFLQDTIGNSILTTNPCNPSNLYNLDYLEVFPTNELAHYFSYSNDHTRAIVHLNGKSFFHPFLLAKLNDKYGVINKDSAVLIPFVYDDIYVINDKLFWVKKNNNWAICTINNDLLTGFDFIDIEKMSPIYFTNLMLYSRIDHSMVGKTYHKFVRAHDDDISTISNCAGLIKRFEKSHNYYTNLVGSPLIAKKNDGYHLITINTNDSIFNLQVDANCYDNILLVPGYRPGFQKGDKYGIEPDDISFDGVLIDLSDNVYDFYGSYSHRIYISPELLLKNGKKYGYIQGSKRLKRIG
jgi:hypothetical protein